MTEQLPALLQLQLEPAGKNTLAGTVQLLGQVPAAVERYLLRGLEGSDNTRRAYAADLRAYEHYCLAQPVAAWPASVATLTGYVAHLADTGRKLATIERHLAAIEKNQQLQGWPSVRGLVPLQVLRRGVARELGKQQKQAPAFSVPHLKRCIDALDLSTAEGLRTRAVLLVGFAGAFRRSELVALNVEDVRLAHSAEDEVLLVRLARSKANQTGEVEEKALFYAASPAYCPVRALRAWLGVLGRDSGPLFVSLARGRAGQPGRPGKRRLSAHHINNLVKQALGAEYSAHSLRASFITKATLAGQSNRFIKNQTGQKTDAMISRYSRLTDVVRYNAARALDL